MAEYDDNPFADPSSINPFADPSVTAATGVPAAEPEYNPFAEESKPKDPEPIKLPPPPKKAEVKAKEKEKKKEKKPKQATKRFESEPAIMEADDPPPSYSPAPSSFKEDDELRKREQEIAKRESALSDREKNIERLGSGDTPKNFPPFPKCCPSPFKPCFYINIKVEVPPSEHWKVYCLLALMIYLWVLLVINTIVSIVGAIAIGNTAIAFQGEFFTTMGVAVVYLVLFAPGTFFCWFLPVYYAYKKDSSLAFMWFFFVMLFQCLSFILSAIGIPNLGACGFFNGARLFGGTNSQTGVGAMYMIVGFLWFIGLFPAIMLLIVIHRYYRTSGGSINKAVTEGVQGAVKNEAVKGAVKSSVKAGVKTAFSDDK